MGYEVCSLKEIISNLYETDGSLNGLQEPISHFHCSIDSEEDEFFHFKMIDYECLNKARTYWVMDDDGIVAYFSLAIKSIDLQDISKSKRQKLTAGESRDSTYSAYLIGHLAKNDGVKDKLIKDLLNFAFERIYQAQRYVGGRIVYLDCKDNPSLKKLYEQQGFKYFNKSESGLLQYYIKL